MCHHLGFAGIQNRGKLIYLPETEIDQAGLNQVVRMLWVAEATSKGDLKNTATNLLSRLDRADIPVKSLLGSSEPSIIGDFMAGLSPEEYAQRHIGLTNIYLLPNKQAYLPYLKLWVEASKSYKPEDWVATARQKFESWKKSG
ncbi:HNH endonuclease (plasmid) [Pseudomonas amygdali pv. lachrymans str. M301315]|uniref:HNH endonuclease n=2 Tax=Pseudomonas amygdali TaxID=47877 RepID=A0AAD0PUC1_PSEAV|nr:HNH endonuclease [Pseudomonas amygdali pv. lachrymans str. M301315]